MYVSAQTYIRIFKDLAWKICPINICRFNCGVDLCQCLFRYWRRKHESRKSWDAHSPKHKLLDELKILFCYSEIPIYIIPQYNWPTNKLTYKHTGNLRLFSKFSSRSWGDGSWFYVWVLHPWRARWKGINEEVVRVVKGTNLLGVLGMG